MRMVLLQRKHIPVSINFEQTSLTKVISLSSEIIT
jgi:hypothetical protein